MTKLKKVLSMLLAIVMIASTVPVAAIAADASATDSSVLQLGVAQMAVISSPGERAEFYFTPEESGVYAFYSMGSYDTYGYLYLENGTLVQRDDDSGDGNNFHVGFKMTAGQTYKLEAEFLSDGLTGSFPVMVTKGRTMTSVEFHDIDVMESNANSVYYFRFSVTYSDGETNTYSCPSTSRTSFSDDEKSYTVYVTDDRAENPWGIGAHTVTATVGDDSSYAFTVNVIESPIASVTCGYNYVIENKSGYFTTSQIYNEETGRYETSPEFFYYYPPAPNNITITLKDGTVYNSSGFYWNDVWQHVSSNAAVPQNYENRWIKGNTYQINASILGYDFTYEVEVIDTPIASITHDSLSIIENTNGYFTTSQIYNEETGSYETSPEFYIYNNYVPRNFVITMKDGTVYNNTTIEWNGSQYWISFAPTLPQNYDNRWLVGNSYEMTGAILGYNFTYDVDIVESPVESITYDDVTVLENSNGYYTTSQIYNEETGMWEDSPQYYRYNAYPKNLVTTLKDGSVFNGSGFTWNGTWYSVQTQTTQSYENQWTAGNTYTATGSILGYTFEYNVSIEASPVVSVTVEDLALRESVDGYYNGSYYHYNVYLKNPVITLKDGTVINGTSVEWNGSSYSYSLSYNQSSQNPWTGGNTYQVKGSLLGYDFYFDVTIEESPVASIEVAPLYIAANSGYWHREMLGWGPEGPVYGNEYYRYDFQPVDVTITLKDGTVINGNSYTWGNSTFNVQHDSAQSYENPWTEGNTYQATASLLGATTTYDVSILPIQSDETYEYIELEEGVIISGIKEAGETIEIPSQLNGKTVIGVAGLISDSSVKHLIIPDSVLTIGDNVISDLRGLEKVTFGSGIRNLTPYMFLYSEYLMEVAVSEENPYFASVNGELYNKELTKFLAFPTAKSTVYNVPDTVVDTDALRYNIYSGLQVIYSANHPLYVTEDGVTYDKDKTTVLSCYKEKEGKYVMPDTVTTISQSAFEDCDKLTEVVVSSQVSKIVYRAFASCDSLAKIDLPEGLVSIGFQAFEDTKALKSIVLPEGLTTIEEAAFRWSGLTSLTLPDSMETVYWSAFEDTDIVTLDLGKGVKEIHSSAFRYTPVTSVTLPDSLTYLGSNAFYNCTSLKELTIGSGLIEISNSTFFGTGIETLSIPGNVQRIASGAFYATPISKLTLSEGLKNIGEYAFYNCNNLESVHIPASATNISSFAFQSCDQLKTLTVAEGNETYHSAGNCVIVTDEKLLYFGCGGSVIPDDGSVTDINEEAFYDCDGLEEIIIPDSVTDINEYAFYDCDGLEEIIVPDSVEFIGIYAFSNCDKLSHVVLGDGLTYLSAGAFSDCPIVYLELGAAMPFISPYAFNNTDIPELTIPDSVTDIMYAAFARCDQLTTVVMPLSVQSIEEDAFRGCVKLSDVYYEGTEEDRANMSIQEYSDWYGDSNGNSYLLNATWHYNSCMVEPSREHVYDDDADIDCNSCGKTRENVETPVDPPVDPPVEHEHVYDNACDTECNECGDIREITHSFKWVVDLEASCGDDGIKHEECSVCGETRNEETVIPATGNHIYDNDCDETCNACDEEREVSHNFKWVVDLEASCGEEGTKHEECSDCGKIRNADTAIPATGNHSYDNACDADCNTCGVVRVPAEHIYDNDFDATCNECGEAREINTENAPTFFVNTAKGKVGDTVEVTVSLKNNPGIVSMKVDVSYDESVLELVKIEGGDYDSTSFGPTTSNPIAVNWFDTLNPNNTTNGTLATLTFKIKEGATLGDTEITLSYDAEDVYDFDFENVYFATESGKITVIDYIPGDVNDDGVVDNKDAGLLQRYINGWNVAINLDAADVTRDGAINNKDLGLLQRYINNWGVELK